ncbi:MAG: fasciclin domain-containing protein [Halobacteriota archaeon]
MVSKKLFSAVLATLMVLSLVAGTSVAFAQTGNTGTTNATVNATKTATAKATQTLVQTIANNTNLTNFTNLLKKANITNVLNGPGNYTVFAPDDAAFSKVDAATLARWQNNTTELQNVLYYHIVPTKLLTNNFTGSGTLTTVNGYPLPYSVTGTTLKVDNATITKPDINATNGVIHIIDSVMIPPTTTATASATAAPGFLGMPGFEAFYAGAGLLAVAYLVLRRRK